MTFRLLATSLLTALLAGCAGTPKHSDFLGDLSGFEKVPNRNAVYWVAPGVTRDQIESYRAVIIEPVTLALSPTSEHKAIRADEAVAIAGYFHNALVNALQDKYRVVERSGPQVLRIRPAITDLHRDKPISPLEFTPVGLALKGVETVTGMPSPKELLFGPSPFNEGSVEMEFVDSGTNHRLAAFKDTRKGSKAKKGENATWGEIKELLDEW